MKQLAVPPLRERRRGLRSGEWSVRPEEMRRVRGSANTTDPIVQIRIVANNQNPAAYFSDRARALRVNCSKDERGSFKPVPRV